MDSFELDQTIQKVHEAIEVVKHGMCKRVDVNDDVKVYRCGGVIRIDIKVREES